MGRNAISWEEKFKWDLEYIDNITFLNDLKIVWLTFRKVFIKSNSSDSQAEIDIVPDYGDDLLQSGRISQVEYDNGQSMARELIARRFF